MKRTMTLLLSTAVLLLALAGCGRAKQGNMEFTRSPDGLSYTLSGYKNTASQTVLTIPDSFDGLPVTAIGEMAIQNCDDLLRIEIGPHLTEIDKWGIFGCRRLKEFVVSEENTAFAALDGVLLSKDMTRLISYPNANTAVYDKGGALTEQVAYTVPEGVEVIAHCAFYKCYALKEITLPDSLRRIEPRAFHGCENVKQLNLPQGLQSIGNDAFLKCLGLTELTLPSTLEEIGDYAFYSCDNLLRITIYAPEQALAQGHRWLPEPGRKPVVPVWAEG